MMQRNEPGTNNQRDSVQPDVHSSYHAPSWSTEPPPSTLPALPPIRSTTRPRDNGAPTANTTYAGSSSRALVSAHEAMRRDVAAASTAEVKQPPSAPLVVRAGDETQPPLIIPGNGKTTPVGPMMPRRPRSRAMNIALVSIAACLLLALLYAATPLTAGASNKLSNFVGSANAFALPTPTPTLTPTPTPIPKPPITAQGGGSAPNPGASAIMSQISSVFGPYAQGALAIARCESGYDPNAWNPIQIFGSHAAGVFQVLYPSTWNGTSQAGKSPYDAYANILAAHELFTRDGNSWREWACRPY